MRYITATHALNLNCPADPVLGQTAGDWHQSALDWSEPCTADSAEGPFGEFGLYVNEHVPDAAGPRVCANHVRALLDMLASGWYGSAQGMRDDFICNDDYTPLVFEQVSKLRSSPSWGEIDAFMGKEYMCEWLDYKEEHPWIDDGTAR